MTTTANPPTPHQIRMRFLAGGPVSVNEIGILLDEIGRLQADGAKYRACLLKLHDMAEDGLDI